MPGPPENRAPGSVLEEFDILDLLTSLTDRSLVVSEEKNGASRFWLLETVRQYGRDLLLESGESEIFRNRHLDTFLALAKEAGEMLRGPEQMRWMARLEQEHENLRAALEWGVAGEGSLEGMRLCGALILFWWRQGHIVEGRAWCLRAVASPAGASRTVERAQVLQGAGILAWMQGDYAAAGPCYQESFDILAETGDRHFLSFALGGLALVAFGLDDYVAARKYSDEAYAAAVETGDQWDIAWSGYFQGILMRIQGDIDGAFTRFKESIVIYRKLGDRIGLAFPLYDIGLAAYYQGDFATASPYLEESLAIRRETNDLWGVAESQYGLGLVALGQRNFAKARAYHEASASLAQQLGDQSRRGSSLHWLGCIDLEEGDVAGAGAHHEESLAIFRELNDRWGLAHCFAGFAGVAAHQRDFLAAVKLWSAADALRAQIGSPLPPVERARRDAELSAVRSEMGAGEFDRAWKEGGAMSLEHAIDLSMEIIALHPIGQASIDP